MGRALASVNLTALQYHLLLEVAAAGSHGLAQRVLAGRLSAPEARISALVQPLLERGLIRATRSALDRRVVRIRLTRSGASLLAQALEAQRQALVELVRSIPSDEMAAMVEWGMKEYLRLPEGP
jgi:DNA-binding MarR family transcriptional regulator